MENEYIILINIKGEIKEIYTERLKQENYDLISDEDDIILAKKTNDDTNINLENERTVINMTRNMAKRYKDAGFLSINLTKEINYVIERLNDNVDVRIADRRITWPIRQAITKAIADKSVES